MCGSLSRRLAAAALPVWLFATPARSAERISVTYEEAIARARAVAPDLVAARAREGVARAEVGIAGLAPNPTVLAGTSTQAARLSAGASIPLLVFGQRGAAAAASEAELRTVKVEGDVTWNDVRAATARAYVRVWLAESTASARAGAADLVRRLESAVTGRVEVGAAPRLEGLRVHAERLRADAEAQEAAQLVAGASGELARWIGGEGDADVHAEGDPFVPASPPALAALAGRVGDNPSVRREDADARAAQARRDRERALVRPALTLDVGADIGDPTLPTTNYRAQLGIEVPLFHQRGYYVEREAAAEHVARSRGVAERAHARADLVVAYRSFEASSTLVKTLAEGVVPASEAAAVATEESYSLGHAPLVSVLDAERSRIDARLSLLEARASRALSWIDVEHAVGAP